MDQGFSLAVNKYHLEPLLSIRQDDISGLLGSEPGIYVCVHPEPEWFKHFGIKQVRCYNLSKQRQMFKKMADGSEWISPIKNVPRGGQTSNWQNGKVVYLGYKSLPWRLGDVLQTISLFCWLWRRRDRYSYFLSYDFDFPAILAPLLIAKLQKKPIYVEYEDDYTKRRKNYFKNIIESSLRKLVDGAICVNEYMTRYFKGKKILVFNGFANLDYAKSANFIFRDGMTFLFGSSFDEIRGIDLIPDLIIALKKKIKNFTILITGGGPLQAMVKGWNYPEVKYLGFLNDADYAETINKVDACLVLQKPDHPFNLGSFPSKIDEYARLKKPIFILK